MNRGFGLTELMITLVLLSIAMAGAYQSSLRSTRAVADSAKQTELSQRSVDLQGRLRKIIRNIGYNPNRIPFPTYTCSSTTDPNCNSSPSMTRIGITLLEPSKIEFTSDVNRSGIVNPVEHFGFWLQDASGGTNVNLATDGIIERAVLDSCTPHTIDPQTGKPAFLKEYTYVLYGPSTTQPQPLVENVACFEVRYFTPGYQGWAENPEILLDPLSFERRYYTAIRESVDRLQLTVVLFGSEGKLERFVVDTKLGNLPWLSSALANRMSGS